MICRASSLSRHTRPWVEGEGWEGGDTGRETLVPYHSQRRLDTTARLHNNNMT